MLTTEGDTRFTIGANEGMGAASCAGEGVAVKAGAPQSASECITGKTADWAVNNLPDFAEWTETKDGCEVTIDTNALDVVATRSCPAARPRPRRFLRSLGPATREE